MKKCPNCNSREHVTSTRKAIYGYPTIIYMDRRNTQELLGYKFEYYCSSCKLEWELLTKVRKE